MSESPRSTGGVCCRRILFEGRVQGVGFRYTAASAARECGVKGYVRNCADGTVELLAEGRVEDVDRLLANLAETFEGNIQCQTAEEIVLREPFGVFEIRR